MPRLPPVRPCTFQRTLSAEGVQVDSPRIITRIKGNPAVSARATGVLNQLHLLGLVCSLPANKVVQGDSLIRRALCCS